jgi:transglutaminase-like putative cysteine protease
MPVLSIRHLTRYRYRKPVAFGEHRMMFRPRESYDQRLIACELSISPEPASLRAMQDVFGNCLQLATFAGESCELAFESRVRLAHDPGPAFDGLDGAIEACAGGAFAYPAEDLPDLLSAIERRHPDPQGALEAWARRFLRPVGRTSLKALLTDMTQAIHAEFRYRKRLAGEPQSPAETLALKSGSCRDYAVLMMEAARSLGLAARFVSGYIHSPWSQPGRIGGGHTHAWVQVYLPNCGWVEFDPTNGAVGGADLIRVAVARDPRQAAPLWGSYVGEASDFIDMQVEVDVRAEPETAAAAAPPRRPVRAFAAA